MSKHYEFAVVYFFKMKKARKRSKVSWGKFVQRAERFVVHYTNRERRRHGLKPLKFNKNLYRAAKFWSKVQAKNKITARSESECG